MLIRPLQGGAGRQCGRRGDGVNSSKAAATQAAERGGRRRGMLRGSGCCGSMRVAVVVLGVGGRWMTTIGKSEE